MTEIVSNTGPLVALSILDRVPLLNGLFSRVTVTETVHQEIIAGHDRPGSQSFRDHPWLIIAKDPPMPDAWLSRLLDAGEATTIALAIEKNAALVLIDERKGRRAAKDIYGLPIIGTGGLLLRAKKRQLIPAVRPLLQHLVENGYHIHSRLITSLCAAAGE